MADQTRDKLVAATIATLAEEGIGAATARTIGSRAGTNPALIYYHFDSLAGLFAEAARHVAVERAHAYRQRLEQVTSVTELARAARELHEEERTNGNLATLSQLLAGSRTHPQLRPVLHDNFELLAGQVSTTLERLMAGSPLEDALDTQQLARAISAGFIGIELLDHVAEPAAPDLFDTLDTLSILVDLVLDSGTIPAALVRRRLRHATRP